jgi:hypothetical protein
VHDLGKEKNRRCDDCLVNDDQQKGKGGVRIPEHQAPQAQAGPE